MDYKWWFKNLIHIETLFFIFLTILIIYCLFFVKRKKLKSLLPLIEQTSEGINIIYQDEDTKIPESLIKKKKKKLYKHEEKCRQIFQEIFGVKFKTIRPDWLKNPVTKGKNLELDGFNSTIKTPLGMGLAFEYDGRQHSKYTPHFHKNGPKEFVYQVKKDMWKDMKCREKGILLIRIPHFIDYHDLERYIKQRLRDKGMGNYLNRGYPYGSQDKYPSGSQKDKYPNKNLYG